MRLEVERPSDGKRIPVRIDWDAKCVVSLAQDVSTVVLLYLRAEGGDRWQIDDAIKHLERWGYRVVEE